MAPGVRIPPSPSSHGLPVWRGARAVESARLESAWAPKVSRGFESHPLRLSRCVACAGVMDKGGRARWGGSGAL
jgi:hypothetical protein